MAILECGHPFIYLSGPRRPGMKSLTPFHSLMAFRLMSIGKQRCVVGPNHAFNADPNRRAFGGAGGAG
jgi:hypothetical protein